MLKGLRWPSLGAVGLCGPALAFRGLLWACVGRRWPSLGAVGLRGPALAFRELLWACVGLRWPSLGAVGFVLVMQKKTKTKKKGEEIYLGLETQLRLESRLLPKWWWSRLGAWWWWWWFCWRRRHRCGGCCRDGKVESVTKT